MCGEILTTGTPATELKICPLFGGAIEIKIPKKWVDVSDLRQVPDNQECWMDKDEDRMLVVEILEYQNVADHEAARYFYSDLAEINSSDADDYCDMSAVSIPFFATQPSLKVSLCYGCGYQSVQIGSNFKSNELRTNHNFHRTKIELCVIRLVQQQADLLISLSTPTGRHDLPTNHQFSDIFTQILHSFRVVDWKLFG